MIISHPLFSYKSFYPFRHGVWMLRGLENISKSALLKEDLLFFKK